MLTGGTDNLCLLIHHVDTPQKQNDIYIKNITRNVNNEQVCYRIHDVIDNLDEIIINFILFAQALTGCDSTAAFHNFGKNKQFSPNLQPSTIYDEFLSSFFLIISLQNW